MFKNRSLQVKVIKDDDPLMKNYKPKTTPAEYVQLARETAKDAVKGAVVLMSTYVAADTARRVVVHIIATKIK